MAEYIVREEAVNALDRLCDRVCQYSKRQRWVMCGACPLGGAFDVITDTIPAADVAPVRHGRWIDKGKSPYNDMFSVYECSECGIKYQNMVAPERFCGNCGARMEDT